MRLLYTLFGPLALFLALGACARGQAQLQARIAHSRAQVTAARAAQADHVPLAARHLNLACAQLDEAQTLLAHGDKHRAGYLVDRAEADAALAQALAQEVPARATADDLMDAQLDLANHQHPDDASEPTLPAGLDDPEPDAAAMPLEISP